MASLFSAAGVSFSTAKAFKSGSKLWFLHLVADYAGTATGTADDFTAGPGRVGLTLTPSVSKTEIEWEDGDKQTTNTSVSWEASIKTAQKDKGTIYGIYDVAAGNVTQVVAEMTPGVITGIASKRQYITFMGQITDPPAVDAKATEYELKYALGASTGAISINLATGYTGGSPFPGFGATTGTVAQASGKYYGISEV